MSERAGPTYDCVVHGTPEIKEHVTANGMPTLYWRWVCPACEAERVVWEFEHPDEKWIPPEDRATCIGTALSISGPTRGSPSRRLALSSLS